MRCRKAPHFASHTPRRSVSSTPAQFEKAAVCAFFVALTSLWVLWVGQDLSWDVLNHHIYLPFSLLSGRFATDLFAAGPQSYQNPIGYVPFYALVTSGLPDWGVGVGLAVVHGLVALPLHSITEAIWGEGTETRTWRLLAVATAWGSPVFLLVAGTSSTDALATVLLLWPLATVLSRSASRSAWATAGVALGIAVAIKPTNGIFALALLPPLGMRLAAGQLRWSQAGTLGVATTVSALLLAGPWSWWLWQTFGNPVFPLFNEVFKSPFAPAEPIRAIRFMPDGIADWVLRPFEMAGVQRFAVTEASAPDFRPVFLVAVSVAAAASALAGKLKLYASSPTVQLAAFTLTAYLLWMATSGNARYALPLLAGVGLLCVRGVAVVMPQRPGQIAVAAVFALHAANYGAFGEHRFAPRAWAGDQYLPADIPLRLRNEPFLHLSIGSLTYASVAPRLHPEGAMINVIGQMPLPAVGPLGTALMQRIDKWNGRTRGLLRASGGGSLSAQDRIGFNAYIAYLNLHIDWRDCEAISVVAVPGPHALPTDVSATQLLSCRVAPGRIDLPTAGAIPQARADAVFAALEARCPLVFGPAPMVSLAGPNSWARRYVNSDVYVTITEGEDVVAGYFRAISSVYLGKVEDILHDRGLPPCEAWKRLKSL